MNTTFLRRILMALILSFGLLFQPLSIYADVPYKTFTEDHNRHFVRTQDAYTPIRAIEKLGEIEFKEPSDIYIDQKNNIYIADSGNQRIVVIGQDERLRFTFGEEVLNKPTGVFVDDEGSIYVADYGNMLVYKFDSRGNLLQSFDRPSSPLFGENNPYKPYKVTVDKRRNIYIISEGTTNGVIQLSPYGDFLGYFGSNEADFSIKIMLQRMFFTESQRLQLFKNLPPSPTNITIDQKGLIYTITPGDKGESIKQLNISGNNMLPTDMTFDLLFTDIFVDAKENIYTISQDGYIYEYDSEGNLIFLFGGLDDGKSRVGLFVNPAGIAVNTENLIYVVDKERNNVQVFQPTEFTNHVHSALTLYKEGFYVKSQQPWYNVLQMNNLFDLAHKGIGQALYKQQNYEQAIEEFVISNYKKGYSNAYWEIRNRWLQENLVNAFLIVLGCYIFYRILKYAHRKTGIFHPLVRIRERFIRIKLVQELLFLFYFIKNPMDGYYGIRFEQKVSILSATMLYVFFFIVHLFSLYYTGFIFRNYELTDIMLVKEFWFVFGPFALWNVSNYLVSTINDGEGKFTDIYKATIYAFMPYLVFKPILVIVSNVLTFNESFIYEFSNNILIAWTGILLFLMVKEIHNYTIKETYKNLFLTMFSMLILILVLFILYVLLDQVIDFVYSIIQEMIVRANL